MNKLLEFLQEDNGGYSGLRAFNLIILGCFCTAWIHAEFKAGSTGYHPDLNVIGVVIAALTAKVVQKFGEQKDVKQ